MTQKRKYGIDFDREKIEKTLRTSEGFVRFLE
jgi:hypothetical protein